MHVQILMATRNGAAFLEQQLQSIAAQDHENWSLWVSDDHSTDGTRDILNRFSRHVAQPVHIATGPGKGAAANFLSLLTNTALSETDPVALSDQDDVWLPDKLTRSLAQMHNNGHETTPVLFCGATRIVDETLNPRCLSASRPKIPSFNNALVENIAGGNTMVLNAAALQCVRRVGADIDVPFHDWWLYLLVTAVGGEVIYDVDPLLLYRQHPANTQGDRHGWNARLRRFKDLFNGTFRTWGARNMAALAEIEREVTADVRKTVSFDHKDKDGNLPLSSALKTAGGIRGKIRRQSRAETVLISALLHLRVL